MSEAITREAIEREIADISDKLEAMRVERDRLERILGNLLELLHDKYGTEDFLPASPLFNGLPRVSAGQKFAHLSIRQSIQVVLHEAARPLSVREILQALEARGKRLSARAKAETIRAILYRSQEFKKTGEGKWITGTHSPPVQQRTMGAED